MPDTLWTYAEFGRGKKYSENQAEHMQDVVFSAFDSWTDRFAAFVAHKGKIAPGEFRAFGYEPPSHRMADLRLKWRELRMGVAAHNDAVAGHRADSAAKIRSAATTRSGAMTSGFGAKG